MTDRLLRIAHLTVQRAVTSGVRKQLRYEVDAARHLEDVHWETLAVHTGPIETDFERAIPWPFRAIFLRALYGWIVALRLSRKYDYVIMRHIVFDPFALLFAPFIRNRISVHHAKEIEELPLISPGFSGRIASSIEQVTGAFAVRRTVGILGVTSELAEYERDLHAPGKPCADYPNGIDAGLVDLAEDDRDKTALNAIFICGTFSEWHGLDRLINAVAEAKTVPSDLRIHLIGKMSDEQHSAVANLGGRSKAFVVHGFLKTEEYREVLAIADIGIGSLAMDRQNLNEGATLKVRELLANGIPLFSGHYDTAIPRDFAYYHVEIGQRINLANLVNFGHSVKGISRVQVREASLPHIMKIAGMKNLVKWLRSDFITGRQRQSANGVKR